eukprot:UN12166
MKKHAPGNKKAKRIYPHVNPFSDAPYNFPIGPSSMDWNAHFPDSYPSLMEYKKLSNGEKEKLCKVSFVDVGCGFGGLLFRLSELWPNKLGIGMEIRKKAVGIVQERLNKARKEKANGYSYNNVSIIHTNVMKFITHYFEKHSLEIMFFCFPDPHFKKKKHRRRIISVSLLDYYAYLLKENGLIYNITDYKDLYDWTLDQFSKHPLFERLSDNELKNDIIVDLITNKTDEAQRVTKNNGQKYICVYRRKCIPS